MCFYVPFHFGWLISLLNKFTPSSVILCNVLYFVFMGFVLYGLTSFVLMGFVDSVLFCHSVNLCCIHYFVLFYEN
jgi:hypothetical protein